MDVYVSIYQLRNKYTMEIESYDIIGIYKQDANSTSDIISDSVQYVINKYGIKPFPENIKLEMVDKLKASYHVLTDVYIGDSNFEEDMDDDICDLINYNDYFKFKKRFGSDNWDILIEKKQYFN